jgi:rod shape-determining protein MreC
MLFALCLALIAFDKESDPFAEDPNLLVQFRSGFTDAAAPLLDLAAQPIRAIKGIGPYFRRQGELVRENEELRQRIEETQYWVDLAEQRLDRIEIYEEALSLEVEATRERIGAWTVADPQGPFVRSRLIGAGRSVGVRNGFPVINIYGLVGRVVEAGERSSRVLLLTDLNSRIPVMADRTNARAIMVGDNSGNPRLDFVARDAVLEAGDRIVTSGDDGVLPRGLPIGEAQPTREGGWRVQLYSDLAPVDFVWVWPYERTREPEVAEDLLAEAPADTAADIPATQDPSEAAPADDTPVDAAPEGPPAAEAEDQE